MLRREGPGNQDGCWELGRALIAPPALRLPPPYSVEGARGVSLNWPLHPETVREPNLAHDKPLRGQDNHTAREKGTGKMRAPSEEKRGQSLRTWVKLTVLETNCTPFSLVLE